MAHSKLENVRKMCYKSIIYDGVSMQVHWG